jgi:hypothetical protein
MPKGSWAPAPAQVPGESPEHLFLELLGGNPPAAAPLAEVGRTLNPRAQDPVAKPVARQFRREPCKMWAGRRRDNLREGLTSLEKTFDHLLLLGKRFNQNLRRSLRLCGVVLHLRGMNLSLHHAGSGRGLIVALHNK